MSMAKYAIAFDLDTDTLSKTYTGNSPTNAYTDIKNTLENYGFSRKQGSVYFGDDKVDAVRKKNPSDGAAVGGILFILHLNGTKPFGFSRS